MGCACPKDQFSTYLTFIGSHWKQIQSLEVYIKMVVMANFTLLPYVRLVRSAWERTDWSLVRWSYYCPSGFIAPELSLHEMPLPLKEIVWLGVLDSQFLLEELKEAVARMDFFSFDWWTSCQHSGVGGSFFSELCLHHHFLRLLQCAQHGLPLKVTCELQLMQNPAFCVHVCQ